MTIPRKVATSARLLGLTRDCPVCGNQLKSNGRLYYDPVIELWGVGFWCTHDQEVFPAWKPEYQPLIDEITDGLSLETLPDETELTD